MKKIQEQQKINMMKEMNAKTEDITNKALGNLTIAKNQ